MKTQLLSQTAIGRIPGETKVRVDGIDSQQNLGAFTATTLDCTLLETQEDGEDKEIKKVKLPTGIYDKLEVDDNMVIVNAYIGNPSPRDGRRWIVQHGAGLNLPEEVGRI